EATDRGPRRDCRIPGLEISSIGQLPDVDERTNRPGVTQTWSLNNSNDDPITVPGYDLGEVVGRGGMGVVYRATDRAFCREVAVKVLLGGAGTSDGVTRFLDEARITGQLQHPGIPSVYQMGTIADGRPFLAMKLIRGQTLAEKLANKAPLDTLAVFEAMARAVGYAHTEGVIHRDLKPSNVMIGAFGEVQVMDWGLAKRIDHPESIVAQGLPMQEGRETTQDGMIVGTVAYMAPEQAAGRVAEVDARSDVFGLGAILCVMLTGKPPYEGDTVIEICKNAINGKIETALTRLNSSTADRDLVQLCRRCLSVNKLARPADGAEVADEIAHLRHTADERARRAELDRTAAVIQAEGDRKRRRIQAWAAGLVLAFVLLGIASTSIEYRRAVDAERL
ncbi:MAG: serine/threonine-protein kinase, partial [Gemmataceae bacterium]